MIHLALIGSACDLEAYVRCSTRLRGAAIQFHAPAAPEEIPPPDGRPAPILCAPSLDLLLCRHGEQIDAVLLLASPADTPRLLQTAVEARKHVLVRAPLADTHHGAVETLERCRNAPVQITVFQPLLSLPSIQAITNSLDRGELGVPGLFRLHRWNPCRDHPQSPLTRIVPEIDLALQVFRDRPSHLFSPTSAPEQADGFQLHLAFPKNGMAILDWRWALPSSEGYFSCSLIGSSGAAYADDHHDANLLFAGGAPTAIRPALHPADLLQPVQQFVDAITQSPRAGVDQDAGTAALRVAETAIDAARTGRTAHLKGDEYELL